MKLDDIYADIGDNADLSSRTIRPTTKVQMKGVIKHCQHRVDDLN